MSGFIKSLFNAFAVSAAVNGAAKIASNVIASREAAAQMAPVHAPAFDNSNDNMIPFHEQRVFGVPGASLYTADNLGVEAREAGIKGEVRVAQELERLASIYPNTYVFHSVKLPGKIGDIDHLVVQGDTMLLVDSKNWKFDASYSIYHSTFEADFVSRDGEDFVGGEIHLPRQIAEWQVEFMDSSIDVQAVLVIANRKSRVSESVNAPYSFANIDGLATIFSNVFNEEGANILHPLMLNRILSMVEQHTGNVQVPAPAAPVARISQPATSTTKWLVGWSVFNYTVLLLLFPLAGISAIPLLIVTHRHKAFVSKNGLGGGGLLTAVLVFTYILLAGWAVTMSLVLMYWGGGNFI